MTERESQYPFEKIWIDVRKILICLTVLLSIQTENSAKIPNNEYIISYAGLFVVFQQANLQIMHNSP